jgi:hypothetical protein
LALGGTTIASNQLSSPSLMAAAIISFEAARAGEGPDEPNTETNPNTRIHHVTLFFAICISFLPLIIVKSDLYPAST